MIPWREIDYSLPDDGFKTIGEIINSLPDDLEFKIIWEERPLFVVNVADASAAFYLRMAILEDWIEGRHQDFLVDTNTIVVSVEDRPELERLLAENCPCSASWSAVARVAFGSDKALHEFDAACLENGGMVRVLVRGPSIS